MIINVNKNELWLGGLEGLKTKYLSLLNAIDREGITQLSTFLQESDFFVAPASARNHNSYKGGLVEHSIKVYQSLDQLSKLNLCAIPEESRLIVSLLHDICKVNFYKETTRNVKKEGVWMQEPYYSIEDSYPLGHGEKSVIILQRFINLTQDEIMAIRWHMMGFDDSARGYGGSLALREAANRYPLITLLHIVDLSACYLGADHQ